jgi:hypothetical protein
MLVFRSSLHRSGTAVVVCAVMLVLPAAGVVLGREADQGATVALKHEVFTMGVGADVIATMNDGREVRGIISHLADDMFIVERRGTSTTLAYGQVWKIRLATASYQLGGATVPDADAVRRVARGLGIGAKVQVRTATERVQAVIGSIDERTLTLVPDGRGTPVAIPYSEITRLQRAGTSLATKLTIAGLAGLTAGILMYCLSIDGPRSCVAD